MSTELDSVIGQDVDLGQTSEPAAPAEETPAEQVAETPQEPQEPAEQKVVPLAALHEERTRRKELQQQFARSEQARQEMEQRFESRLKALTEALTPKQEVPSFEENPAAHLQHSLSEVRQTAQQTQQQIETWRAQQAQQAQIEAIASRVRIAEEQFVSQKPDYQAALDFYKQSRVRELGAFGVDEEQATIQVGRELMEGALAHAARGSNPAEIAYRLAEARGYKPQAKQDPAEKIQTQQRGIAASKTLGSGGATSGGLSVRALLDMSDEDFAEATKGSKWEKLVGG